MRILHLAKRYPNALGGDAVVVSRLEAYQQTHGHTTFVLTSNCRDIAPGNNITKFGLPISNIAIDHIGLGRIVTLFLLAIYSFWYLRKLRPDVIHSHSMDFGFAMSFAARLYRIPMLNTCHSVSFTQPHYGRFKPDIEVWLLRHSHFKVLITVDASSIPEFAKRGLEPVVYRPIGIDVSEFTPAHPKKDGVYKMLYVGRLVQEKGLDDLLAALAIIKDKIVPFTLRIAGEGTLRPVYEQHVAELGLQNAVEFLGRKMPAEVKRLYAEADVFIMPSRHEAFGLVALEAWASKLPAIIAGGGSMAEVAHGRVDSLVFKPGDIPALAAAIEELRANPTLAKQLAATAYKMVQEQYTYKAMAESLDELYEEVCS